MLQKRLQKLTLLFYWSFVTYTMLSALIPLLLNGNSHSPFVVTFFLFAAAFLTGLQWLWGYKIYNIAMAPAKPEKSKKAE